LCVRRGDASCIYLVTEKVTKKQLCVKEVSVCQARKEFDFAKELSVQFNPNIMQYRLVPPMFLESIWCQYGSYDQYSQNILNNVCPGPVTMISHFLDLVSGVGHIEALKFVHLDLKPANILVGDFHAGTNIPNLLIGDFGTMVEVGTLIDDDQEGDGKYIAPEVFQQNYKASTKFDVFSLALCIMEISTGEHMNNDKWNQFKGWEEEHFEIKKLENLDDNIFQIILKMLSKNPVNRPNATDILPILQNRKEFLFSTSYDPQTLNLDVTGLK